MSRCGCGASRGRAFRKHLGYRRRRGERRCAEAQNFRSGENVLLEQSGEVRTKLSLNANGRPGLVLANEKAKPVAGLSKHVSRKLRQVRSTVRLSHRQTRRAVSYFAIVLLVFASIALSALNARQFAYGIRALGGRHVRQLVDLAQAWKKRHPKADDNQRTDSADHHRRHRPEPLRRDARFELA